jgi:hypothetical protein
MDTWKVPAGVCLGLKPNVINKDIKINLPEYLLKTLEPMKGIIEFRSERVTRRSAEELLEHRFFRSVFPLG